MMTLGFGLFINLPDYAYWPKIIIYQIIAGIGVGPNFQSPLIALQAHVAPHDIATATATFGFIRQLATSMSVVLGGVVFQNLLSKKGPELAKSLGAKTAARLSGANIEASTDFIKSLPPAQKRVANAAITDSLSKMFIFYTAIAALGLFLSLFIKKKTLSKVRNNNKTGLEEQERVRLQEKENRRVRRSTIESPPPTLKSAQHQYPSPPSTRGSVQHQYPSPPSTRGSAHQQQNNGRPLTANKDDDYCEC